MKRVAMVGCGKLGLPCAEVMAKQNDVVGYDLAPFTSDRVRHMSLEEAVNYAEIIFVAVPTPHVEEYGGEKPCIHLEPQDFDYSVVKQVLKDVNRYAHPGQLVVLISTVLPGTVRRELRQCITTPRFIYNPYLIAMGSVAWDFVNPEMVIIGTEDGDVTSDANELVEFYKPLMQNNPRYEIGTWEEAEGIKIFYNTFIGAKISLVNMMLDVAERVGNMNVDIVTEALSKSTHRITGPAYMRAGMGDAGACHPRDNIALRWMANDLNLGYDLFETIMGSRERQAQNMAVRLVQLARENWRNAVWIHGKAYKPNVPYTAGSYSLLVGHYVEELGLDVFYVDPLTGDNQHSIQGVVLWAHHAPTTYGNTSTDLANEQPAYCQIAPGSIILDPWRKLSRDAFDGVRVVHYGNTRDGQ
jgi:UDPglucose 6-dehydrogenase